MQITRKGKAAAIPHFLPPQLVKAMKLTALFLTLFLVQASARISAQQVSYSAKGVSLETAFAAITEQTHMQFFYEPAEVAGKKLISVDFKNLTLEKALEVILKDQPLEYKIKGKTIFINAKGKQPTTVEHTAELALPPPPVTVHGKVTNENGESVVGATISIKGGKAIGTTDSRGEYTVTVPDVNVTLVFSAVTIETVEWALRGKSEINVMAKTKVSQLAGVEVVNKGYYSVKQRENTGSVSVVKGEDIAKQPVSDPMVALEGRIAGLQITQFSGVPGANVVVRLRGQNSMRNGNDPLYIVDGVPFNATTLTSPLINGGAVSGSGGGLSPFNLLSPWEIDNIEVLKDADATAIYGSRGANGVILITTKKGKSGETRIDVNVNSGFGKAVSHLNLLNTQQYLQMRREAFKNDGVTTIPTNNYDVNGVWDTTRYTDWQKELIGGTARFSNAQLSFSGGNGGTQFLISGNYSKQTTVFPGDSYDQKASLHTNINHFSANRKFHLFFSGQYLSNNNKLGSGDLTSNITLAPDAPSLYDANGNLNFEAGTFLNPLIATRNFVKTISNSGIGNLNIGYEILTGLQISASMGYTTIQSEQTSRSGFAGTYYGPIVPNNRVSILGNTNSNTWIIEPKISYKKIFQRSKLDVLVGGTFQESNFNATGVRGSGFPTDDQMTNMVFAGTIQLVGYQNTLYRYNALYAQIGYNYNDRYLLNLTGRRDGSSRFGSGNQFGNFGAIGGAWIFSDENWIKDKLPWLSFGKLRTSYGSTGSDQITDYGYLNSYSTTGTYQNMVGLVPNRLVNPYFAWEVTNKLEFGVELGFLHDAVQFNVNYFRNRSANQLVGIPLSSITGFQSITGNLPATVQNAGFEFDINTKNIDQKDFKWNTSLNLTVPRNKLVSFPGLASSQYSVLFAEGQPLNGSPLYHYLGVDPQTGAYLIEDLNKDGKFDSKDQLFQSITPNYYGGIDNNFSYKGWHLDVFVQVVNQTGNSLFTIGSAPGFINYNQPTAVLDRWQTIGDQATYGRFFQTGGTYQTAFANAMRNSDRKVVDASFVRLKNVSLDYTFNNSWLKNRHLKGLKIYVQGQNLLTFTDYLGVDPETQGYRLPPLRMIVGGIVIGL